MAGSASTPSTCPRCAALLFGVTGCALCGWRPAGVATLTDAPPPPPAAVSAPLANWAPPEDWTAPPAPGSVAPQAVPVRAGTVLGGTVLGGTVLGGTVSPRLSMRTDLASLRSLSTWLTVLVTAWLVVDGLMLVAANAARQAAVEALRQIFATPATADPQLGRAAGLVGLFGLLSMVTAAVLVAAYIVFMVWFRPAYRLGEHVTGHRLPWSVDWVSWGWLLPIVSWVIGWQVLSAIADTGPQPASPRRTRYRVLLTLWLSLQAVAQVMYRTSITGTGTGLAMMYVCQVGSGVAWLVMVRDVTASLSRSASSSPAG
jgi:hypothetical protein